MRLSREEVDAIKAGLKRLVKTSTVRFGEWQTLITSPHYMKAFTTCREAGDLAESWEGSRDELDARLKGASNSIVADLAAADAITADFPLGTGDAFGMTTGTPVVGDGATACHMCEKTVSLIDTDVVFMKVDAGHDVLLFVMHPGCWTARKHKTLFRIIGREEWELLLAAKSVLSS